MGKNKCPDIIIDTSPFPHNTLVYLTYLSFTFHYNLIITKHDKRSYKDYFLRRKEEQMELQEKMKLLSELFELDLDEFSPETVLEDMEEWDSLAAISYIVMMDEEFNIAAKPVAIKNFQTVQDILDTMVK